MFDGTTPGSIGRSMTVAVSIDAGGTNGGVMSRNPLMRFVATSSASTGPFLSTAVAAAYCQLPAESGTVSLDSSVSLNEKFLAIADLLCSGDVLLSSRREGNVCFVAWNRWKRTSTPPPTNSP